MDHIVEQSIEGRLKNAGTGLNVVLWVVVIGVVDMAVGLSLIWALAPQAADAVVKKSQSFVFGRLGRYNNCVHIAVDENHLHLIPPSVFRLLGAKVISLPLDSMCDVKPSAWPGMVRARINGTSIAGPNCA